MISDFLKFPQEEQRKLFTVVAYQTGLGPTVIEKDLWVCWALSKLFSMDISVSMGFKGGTSLSKVYKLIQRFSEDLDITLDYRAFKKLDLPIESYTRSFLKKFGEELKSFVQDTIYQSILPNFEKLAKETTETSVLKFEVNNFGDSIRIYYPTVFAALDNYLSHSILIEFGARNITEPNEIHVIKPYLADHIKGFELSAAKVNVLSPLKTFWEKVTLIHVECHRGRIGQQPDRLSRHWYDLAKLCDSPIAIQALADT